MVVTMPKKEDFLAVVFGFAGVLPRVASWELVAALAFCETAEGTRELLSLEAENWVGRRVVFWAPVKEPEARSGRPRVVEMPPGLLPSVGSRANAPVSCQGCR